MLGRRSSVSASSTQRDSSRTPLGSRRRSATWRAASRSPISAASTWSASSGARRRTQMPDQQTIDKHVAEREERRRQNAAARRRRREKAKAKRTPGEGSAEQPPAKEHGPGRPR